MCTKGCCEVGQHIYGENSTFFDDENNDNTDNEISHFEAYEALYDGCHPQYNLPAYCVEINHVDCLKTISKEKNFMWHADLAIIAIENDNLEALIYIVDNMGDVEMDIDMNDVGPNCKRYVKKLLIKLNGETYIKKVM